MVTAEWDRLSNNETAQTTKKNAWSLKDADHKYQVYDAKKLMCDIPVNYRDFYTRAPPLHTGINTCNIINHLLLGLQEQYNNMLKI